jgi:hypothetical protein
MPAPVFTQSMMEILAVADIERGEINAVPSSTLHAFEASRLISTEWRTPMGTAVVVDRTGSGKSTTYNRVKLTPAGLRAATRLRALIAKSEEVAVRV